MREQYAAVAAAGEGNGSFRILPYQLRLTRETAVLETYGHKLVAEPAAVVYDRTDSVGGAIVQRTAVFGPCGEGFHHFISRQCGTEIHRVGLKVHQYDVGAIVVYFYGLQVVDGETLVGVIGRESDVAPTGMPCRVRALAFRAQ